MTTLLVLRHGQSAWNALGRWQGLADPPLSDIGRAQAQAAAKLIDKPDGVVASTLERARHTAAIIAESFGVGPVDVHQSLVERDVGPLTGLTFAEIEQRWPGIFAGGSMPDGVEADHLVCERASQTLLAIAEQRPGGVFVVVTHGGVIRSLERSHDIETGAFRNLCGRVIEVVDGRFRFGDRLDLAVDQPRGTHGHGRQTEQV